VPGRGDPVRVPRGSEALFMLQRIRDESHRFAIAYHRQLRGKRMTESELDEVQGLGPKRRERLLKAFGSVAAIRKASLEELTEIPWLPDQVAASLHDHLHQP
jgi:excinuclease ABC subunit C